MSERVLGDLERDPDVALGAEVVDLVGLQLVDQLRQRHRLGEVAVVHEQAHAPLVGVAVEVVDPLRVEARGAADDPVHLVPAPEQQLGEVRAVLAGDPGDESSFRFGQGLPIPHAGAIHARL